MGVQNLSSEGSLQNLQRLLDRQADFAPVQLNVVSDVVRQGKVQAIATLANEPIHGLCRNLLEQRRKRFVLDTLLLLDDWQASLQLDPQAALQKLNQIKQQYREMLLADQVDIKAYIELMELISVMTLVPQTSAVSSRPTISHS
jgi:hypothetical protein